MSKLFKLHSEFKPAGDQPEAIRKLEEGWKTAWRTRRCWGHRFGQDIHHRQRDSRSESADHGAGAEQDAGGAVVRRDERVFPENAVEYFVSYYDYYQPEAYVPSSDTFIEKTLR